MIYTIYYTFLNRMDTMKVFDEGMAYLRKKCDEIILAGGTIQCIKNWNGEVVTL